MKKKEKQMLELERYMEGEVSYTPIMNIFLNNRKKNWYAELGVFILKEVDFKQHPDLSFLEKYQNERSMIDKLIDDITGKKERIHSMVSISFLTSVLGKKDLEKVFGAPLYHRKFGEGFNNPKAKTRYASYFVTVEGVNLHIGFDHRGTSIEAQIDKETKSSILTGEISDVLAEKTLSALKSLVLLWKEKTGITEPKIN
jgi:hypothetical protein